MFKRIAPMALMLCLLVFTFNLTAKERRVKRSELPPAVQKTADEQSKGATVRGYAREMEGDRLEYEVETKIGDYTRDVSIASDGSILEIEEQVAMGALPAEVREGLRQKAGAGTITKIESITKGGKVVAYEAQVRTHGQYSEVQVGPDGKPLAHEE